MRMSRKYVAFKMRIEEELRKEFLNAYHTEDMTAAQVVRRFMRDYVDRHRKEIQYSLFDMDNGNEAAGSTLASPSRPG